MFDDEKDILEIKEEEKGDTLTPSEEVDDNQEQPIHENTNIVEVEEEIQETPENNLTLDENIENLEPELPEEQEVQKMFDQKYVNDLVGRTRIEARDKAMRSLYDRYGVDNEDELNDIFGRGQSYDILNNDYNDLNTRYSDVMAENALLKSKTDESRWDDIRLILKGKGLDITPENIAMELTTHPEWMNNSLVNNVGEQGNVLTPETMEQVISNPVVDNRPSAKIKRLGSDVPPTEESNEEEEFMNKYFGI